MALHMLRSTPSFTVTLRGYDKDEVDEYIESLRDSQEGDAEALADADSRVQFLDSEVQRMTGRVSDLERALRSETPRSIGGLGERLVLILDQAEAGANETVALAQSEADSILAAAHQAGEAARHEAERTTGEAQARAANTCKTAEQTAWRLEHEAQLRADEILRQSEAQAEARIAEIEQWAAQVRAQITSDQVRAREEFARVKARRDSEIHDLISRRDAIISGMDGVSGSLLKAIAEARQVTGRRPGEEQPEAEIEEHPASSAIDAAPKDGADQ
ncbi:MAG: DivIVA domain-containing protein, partial [Acidimicrobiales bacterium]